MKPFDHDRKGHKRSHGLPWRDGPTKYWDGYADFGDFKVYDKDVADYVKAHLRFQDRFDIRKITEAVLLAFSILSKSVEEPEEKNWKF